MAITDHDYGKLVASIGLQAANAVRDAAASSDALTDYGITADAAELNILDGVTATAAELNAIDLSAMDTARTATANGLTTGTIAGGKAINFITVTSADANHIIVLPAPTPGTIVILKNGGTGYELRTSAPDTIAINGGSGANAESAIAANTMVIAVCTSATTWQAIGLAGVTLAAVEAAA